MVTIRRVTNGYIVSFPDHKSVYAELQGVFDRLLQHFEGLASTFSGDMRGIVIIQRGADSDLQLCGHPRSAIVTGGDLGGPGTSYCDECSDEADIEAAARMNDPDPAGFRHENREEEQGA